MIHGTDLHCFDVHNDGYFSHLPLSYVNGVILNMVVPRMPYEKFAEYLEEKCGNYFQGLYYQVPNIELERSLVRVSNDRELSDMFNIEKTFGRLELYLDHLDMDLLEYLSQAITTKIDVCVSKTTCHPKKRYCNNFSMDEMVDWAEMKVEQQGRSSQHQKKMTRAKRKTVKMKQKVLKLGLVLHTRAKRRNRMKANREAKIKLKVGEKNFNFSLLVNYKGIGKVFGDKIRANPDIRLCDIDELVMKKYKCKVTPNQCTNAKKYVLTEYEKTVGEHYMLRSYRKAILDSNPGNVGSDFPIKVKILTAIGRDGNNHIYPLAWAVVNVENKDNWSWFLELLEEDLGCNRGNGLTLMSDQHKGIIEAVKDVMPNAEHMQCARHIYENFRKNYSGLEFRNFNWATSKASYPQLFNKIMDKIESVNPNAHNVIASVRHRPLLTMLEAIRVIVLERMNKIRELVENGILEFWHVIPVDENLFEVHKEVVQITKNLHNKAICKEPILEQTPKPKGVPGRPRKKQVVVNLEDVDVDVRGTTRDASEQGSNDGAQQGSAGAGGSKKGGAGGSKKGGAGRSKQSSAGAGASGSKRKVVSSAGTQKRQGKMRVGTSGFARWFGLQDEPMQTQDDPVQTQDDPVQTQADPVLTQDHA
ncbi:multidrug resistance-associated protein 5 [Tanacetum coccineum]